MTHLLALAGILTISLAAILVRLADVSATTATLYRCLYATPVLALLWWSVRDRDDRGRRFRVIGLSAGALLAADLSLWHESILRIGAGLGTVLVNVQVVFVGVLAWLLHGERPRQRTFVTVPVILCGVVLVSGLGRRDAFGVDPLGGVVFGVVAGAAYAGYLLALRGANPGLAPTAGPLLEATLGALVGTALVAPLVDPGFTWRVPVEAHGWLVVLGVVVQVGGWLLIGHALPRLPALETSIMMLVQPLATMVWGALLLGESVSAVQLGGVLLVLAGVAVSTVPGARSSRRATAVET